MAKKFAIILGIVFVLVGLLGFISNGIVGSMGYFMTDTVHNLVHLLIGVLLLVASSKGESASLMCMKIVGVIYLVLAVLGFLMPGKLLGFIMSNTHDTWLHLVLGVVILGLGMMKGGSSSSSASSMPSMPA